MAIDGQQLQSIKVDITSDAICPFCVLGYRNLQSAIKLAQTAQLPLTFTIQFQPFLLDPTLSDEPICKTTRYIQKFGKDRFESVQQQMIERGKKVGVNFSYKGQVSQTTNYHRLTSLAYRKGGSALQLPFVEALFSGYFENAQDPGNIEYLAKEATKVGIFESEEKAQEWLKGTEGLEEVKEGYKRAAKFGITGVPFFVFANKYAVSGAQPPEAFFEVFQELAKQTEF